MPKEFTIELLKPGHRILTTIRPGGHMKNALYFWYAALAYIRGWLGCRNMGVYPTCSAALNGPGEARSMFVSHGWKPYIYRRAIGSRVWSRTFITGEIDTQDEPNQGWN